LEAEGKPETIAELKAWAHRGPEHARVKKVEVQELASLAGFEDFEQRR
ncbi:MAG TPA: acylphosphatase, partial [Pontibacter sp.]